MAFTVSWTAGYEAEPAGGDNVGGGDEEFQNLKIATRERMQVDHEWRNVQQDGKHNQVTLIETAGVPTTPAATEALLYADAAGSDSSIQRLFHKTDGGVASAVITQYDGPPIGAIIAVSGTFSAADNGGTYNTTGVSVGAAWKICDGTVISNAASPFNGRYVPKIDDSRFLRGGTVGGTVGGQTTLTPNSAFTAAGTYTPSGTTAGHTHTSGSVTARLFFDTPGNLLNVNSTGAASWTSTKKFTPGTGTVANDTTSLVSVEGVSTYGSTASATDTFTASAISHSSHFLGTAVNIEPKYLAVIFYQRIV